MLGPIAAGEKVVTSIRSPEYEFIRNSYNDAVAVEMEGYGFLHAGYSNTTNCLVIRGISDVVEGKADADSSGSQPRAAAAAAGFAFELIAFGKERALHVSDSEWQRLEKLAVSLYPLGPAQNEVWSRAGGDQATLQMGTVGMASWHYAFRLLRNGGGGRGVSFKSLLATFFSDHPNNLELASLNK
jgi:adenosylhomocysteine nucleosidase